MVTVTLTGLLCVATVVLQGLHSRRLPDRRPGIRAPRAHRRVLPVEAEDVADLAEQVAGLALAGVGETRSWQVLAGHAGPCRPIAGVVAAVVTTGGTPAEGLRLAATRTVGRSGLGATAAEVVAWLAIATDVVERSGAPSAVVLGRISSAVRAEAAATEQRRVAMAGARATAAVLAALPVVGIALGFLMGADVPGTLVGTEAGRVCLVAGLLLWVLGRAWTRRLVAMADASGAS